MNHFPFSEDIQVLVWFPLALICLKEVKENWRQIFDKDLTVSDRRALLKITLFFALPVVVLIHEIGHALATIMLGGVVKELHFGIWWGYVLPIGDFSSLDHLIITLAGNVVQMAIGFLCLNRGCNRAHGEIAKEAVALVRDRIGPVAAFKTACIVDRLPKTRSGKILRGTMVKIADGEDYKMPATIDDPVILDEIAEALRTLGYPSKG